MNAAMAREKKDQYRRADSTPASVLHSTYLPVEQQDAQELHI